MPKNTVYSSEAIQRITTQDVTTSPGSPTVQDLYPDQPAGATGAGVEPAGQQQINAAPGPVAPAPMQTGVNGEVSVWDSRYSLKNFIGRFLFRGLLTLGWIALAAYTWGTDHGYERLPLITGLLGAVLLLYWLSLAWQIIRARLGHHYELTTKRLFVSTGVFQRRRDQVELLRINDVYIKQPSIFHRTFNVGTVVVESSEEKLPISYLAGIDDPKAVMDLIWHHARTERDLHSVKVDQV